MASLLQVNLFLFTLTLFSAVAPAFAVTRIGNAVGPQIASCICQGKVMPPKLCPVIRCADEAASSIYSNDHNKTLSYRIETATPYTELMPLLLELPQGK